MSCSSTKFDNFFKTGFGNNKKVSKKCDLNLLPDGCDLQKNKITDHRIKFQVFDAYDFPLDGTQFWVIFRILVEPYKINISIPSISFQTGAYSPDNFYVTGGLFTPSQLLTGGKLRSIDGFLPPVARPNSSLPLSFPLASGNGQALPFAIFTDADQQPLPNSAYLLTINESGEVVIQSAGTFSNLIAPGSQNVLPTDISYLIQEPVKRKCKNQQLSRVPSNITEFTIPAYQNDGYRDTHVNDAFDGIESYTWTSTAGEPNTGNTLNTFVSVSNGSKTYGPTQLTKLPADVICINTASAIVRTKKNIVIASYGIADSSLTEKLQLPCRAISRDGGKTWPRPYVYTRFIGTISGNTLTVTTVNYGSINVGDIISSYLVDTPGLSILPNTTIVAFGTGTGGVGTYTLSGPPQTVSSSTFVSGQIDNGPVQGVLSYVLRLGDCRGVLSDKYGNVFYSVTNRVAPTGDSIGQPVLSVSTDYGLTFTQLYLAPLTGFFTLGVDNYDYPQLTFGGSGGSPNVYGIWLTYNYFPNGQTTDGLDIFPVAAFVEIDGFGLFGPQQTSLLSNLENCQGDTSLSIAASSDGRVWTYSNNELLESFSPSNILFKSPGAPNENWAGPFLAFDSTDYASQNVNAYFNITPVPPVFAYTSYPVLGYFDGTQSIIWDEVRQVLFLLAMKNSPSLSQNVILRLFFSPDNGLTWSAGFEISSSTCGNRGLQSMALDPVKGTLAICWYDGRNDPTRKLVDYFKTRISKSKLDKWVGNSPVSNPLFQV